MPSGPYFPGSFTETDFSKNEIKERKEVFRAWRLGAAHRAPTGGDETGLPLASKKQKTNMSSLRSKLQPRAVRAPATGGLSLNAKAENNAKADTASRPSSSITPVTAIKPSSLLPDDPEIVRPESTAELDAIFRDIEYPEGWQRPSPIQPRRVPLVREVTRLTSSQARDSKMSNFFTSSPTSSDSDQDAFPNTNQSAPHVAAGTLSEEQAVLPSRVTRSGANPNANATLARHNLLSATNISQRASAPMMQPTRLQPTPGSSVNQAAAQGNMPPPPGSQNGQVPPAQDGLPQEAMAQATYNTFLGMYTPHPDWHAIPNLDAQYLSREKMELRIRYLFDFMATPAGGRGFVERIGSNLRIARATLRNANRHVDIGQQQLDIMEGLPIDSDNINAPNGVLPMTAGKNAITKKLNVDKFWQDVFGIELRMCELSLARVQVARKATVLLGDLWQGLELTPEGEQELRELYKKFQSMRDEILGLFRAVNVRIGDGRALSDMLQRHRNEMWDIWGGL